MSRLRPILLIGAPSSGLMACGDGGDATPPAADRRPPVASATAARSYRVPPGATRLFLGFADGYDYKGLPGWYGNNAGGLSVTVAMASR